MASKKTKQQSKAKAKSKPKPRHPPMTHRLTLTEVFVEENYKDENGLTVMRKTRSKTSVKGQYITCLVYVDEYGAIRDSSNKEVFPEVRDETGKVEREALAQWDDDTFRVGEELAEKFGVSVVAA
ncbi:MAG: hypothetical protein K0U78_16395 [Actinomycetia bacterium]|nr:hypothetical protein [Actinomycetes bacterium]